MKTDSTYIQPVTGGASPTNTCHYLTAALDQTYSVCMLILEGEDSPFVEVSPCKHLRLIPAPLLGINSLAVETCSQHLSPSLC